MIPEYFRRIGSGTQTYDNEKRGEAQYIKKSETTTAVGIPDFLFRYFRNVLFCVATKLLSMAWAMTCIFEPPFFA